MESVAANLGKLTARRVLVAGDAMLDRYWLGAVDRISPEAPVPVVAVKDVDERLGGAANVARNIAALGGRCALLALRGDDANGRTLAELAARADLDCHLIADRAGQTAVKLRVVAQKQQLLRVDFESPPGAAALAAADAKFTALLAPESGDNRDANCQVVVLSDYGKGGLTHCARWIAQSRANNIPVVVDPKGGDFSRYRGASLVTPNLTEFEQAAGAVAGDDDMRVKAEKLLRANEIDKLLITLSARGMMLVTRDGVMHRRARAREVYDVSGAGDTVVAVMAMAIAAGLTDNVALGIANAAAGVVVSKLGTASATRAEVQAEMTRETHKAK